MPTEEYSPILYYRQRARWIRVDLFFVLSGFLVSDLLFREYARYGEINVSRFYVRRGLKIYPAFYVFLGISLLYLAGAGHEVDPLRVLSEVFCLQNYFGRLWGHTGNIDRCSQIHAYFTATPSRSTPPPEVRFL